MHFLQQPPSGSHTPLFPCFPPLTMMFFMMMMEERLPADFLTADKSLRHAQHVFGTKADARNDVNETIRIYTERLGPIAHMTQVHSDRIVYASVSGVYEECDALYTDHDNLWLAVKTADCVPILISSPAAVAVVHAGRRGLETGILPKMLTLLMDEFALSPLDIHVHIGPHISQNNYEIEEHFQHDFDEKFFKPSQNKGKVLMDLAGIAIQQATDEGIQDLNIFHMDRCTFNDSETFFSYRRFKKNEATEKNGRQISLIKKK